MIGRCCTPSSLRCFDYVLLYVFVFIAMALNGGGTWQLRCRKGVSRSTQGYLGGSSERLSDGTSGLQAIAYHNTSEENEKND